MSNQIYGRGQVLNPTIFHGPGLAATSAIDGCRRPQQGQTVKKPRIQDLTPIVQVTFRYGNANTRRLPPATIPTNCLPLFEVYVIGFAFALPLFPVAVSG